MQNKIVVIGGGLTGLSAVHRILQNDPQADVQLFEASPRLGGVIETIHRNGYVIEKGPDSFLSLKQDAIHLAEALGIADQLVGTSEKDRVSFIARGNSLHPVPDGFYLIAPSKIKPFLKSPILSLWGKLRFLGDASVPVRTDESDESIADFVTRRFGQEALDRLAQPIVAGIYTGNPADLSMKRALPRFIEYERKYGSVIRGVMQDAESRQALREAAGPRYSLFMSFREGMQTLVDTLIDAIPSKALHVNAPVDSLAYDAATRSWRIRIKNGSVVEAHRVVLAVSPSVAARLVRGVGEVLSIQLNRIPSESVATLSLAYDQSQIRRPVRGFGFVVPAIERSAIIACSFSHAKFEGRAPEGKALLRVFVGGAFGQAIYNSPDSVIQNSVCSELRRFLDVQGEPEWSLLTRFETSMPQYRVGHDDVLKDISNCVKNLPGLYFAGGGYDGVGIGDCIRQANEIADKISK